MDHEAENQRITVRPSRQQDFPEVVGLMHAYFDFYQVPRADPGALRVLLNRLADEPARGIQLIAERDGRVIGFATLYATFDTLVTAEVLVMNDLFVDGSERGAGVGKALFAASRDYANEHGYARMDWVTATDNKVARRFYESQGGRIGPWVSYSIDPAG